MRRAEVTAMILAAKGRMGMKWISVAEAVGASKEWVTAGCLGQMTFDARAAEAVELLQTPPYRGSLPTGVPTDPVSYRFYELVQVYGTTFKELIHEEFGDGIMSAIDFKMDIAREKDPAGDRVGIRMSGKFLPYRQY